VILARKNLLSEGCSLEDSEFGRLVNEDDALRTSSFGFNPNQTQQGTLLLYLCKFLICA
jgi:hypothetical protein